MSANNQLLIKKHKGKFYVFNVMAESWSDENELSTSEAIGVYDNFQTALTSAIKIDNEEFTEYGIGGNLFKDGKDVKIIE